MWRPTESMPLSTGLLLLSLIAHLTSGTPTTTPGAATTPGQCLVRTTTQIPAVTYSISVTIPPLTTPTGTATGTPLQTPTGTPKTSTSTPTATTRTFVTTTKLSSFILSPTSTPLITTSSVVTTTAAIFTGPVICEHIGGPSVADYCECSTTTAGQTFYASATWWNNCLYETFPAPITLAPTTTAPHTTAHIATPFTTTETNGAVLVYPDQKDVTAPIGGMVLTFGVGTPSTLVPPGPTQTSGNDKGSSLCRSLKAATCQNAADKYVDDTTYKAYTSYVDIELDFVEFNVGCAAMYKCDNDADYAKGLTGKQIKNAVQYMMDNDSVEKCGSTYLSNGCHITLNYCSDCKSSNN